MRVAIYLIPLILTVAVPTLQASPRPNCKLTIQKTLNEGHRKMKIEEVFTRSRKACKKEAEKRKLNVSDEVKKISVRYSWRDPFLQF